MMWVLIKMFSLRRYQRPSLMAVLCAGLLCLPLLASGQTAAQLVAEQCVSCHDMTGPAPTTLAALWTRKGPDLFYAGNKYRQDWLASWLQTPARIRPAGMFYADHIKTTTDGDVVDKTTLTAHPALPAESALAVAKYLMTLTSRSALITAGDYKPGKISPAMGEMMFDKFRGCLACHQIEPGYGGASGPEVYTVVRRLQADYLISFMRNPQAWDPRTFMPNKKLKEQDLQKLVHYFRGLSEVAADE
jgi:mono/diheme cytochrome c family protein